MKIRTFGHQGLKRLCEDDNAEGVPPDPPDTLRMVHTLTGDRKGAWSLCVTGNRRLAFTIDDNTEICDLNLEHDHWHSGFQRGLPTGSCGRAAR